MPADSYDVVVFENRFPSLRGASMAVWVNDIVPETAARRLREA